MINFDKNFIFIKSQNIIESYKLTAKIIYNYNNNNNKNTENFVVFNKNIKSYDNIFSNILEKYNINYNRDYEFSIINSQISNLIFSCLNLLISGFTKKNIFDFLSSYSNYYLDSKDFSQDEISEFKNYCNIYNIQDFNSKFIINLHKKFVINNETLDSIEKTRIKILNFVDNLKKNINKFGIFNYLLNIIQDKSCENYKNYKNYNIFINILKLLSSENNLNINNLIKAKNILKEKFQNINILPNNKNQVNLISDIANYLFLRLESIFLIIKNYDEFLEYKKILEKFDKKYIIIFGTKNFENLNLNILDSSNYFILNNKNKENNNKNTEIKINNINNNYINLNISQIEFYYKCSIFYFLKFVLKIEDKKNFAFDSLEYGSLVHFVLEKYLKEFYNFNNKLDIKEIVIEYIIKKFSSIYSKYKLNFLINKISKNLEFLIKSIIKINNTDNFKPKYFEVKIERKIRLENNFFINLNGKIDRIDINKKDKKFKIIDYKTGKKVFDLNDVLYGTDLQAVIYLNSYSIAGFEKSGTFYFSTKKPLISNNNNNNNININNIEKKIENNFFYQGISTENNNNNNNKYIYELTKNQMEIILKYSDFMIKQAVENILNGEVYKNPKNFSGNNSSCETCEYKDICKNFNIKFIKLKKYKKIDEIINIMIEKLESKNK